MRHLSLILTVVALGCGERADPFATARSPSSHVLLITVDTLRADRLGCYGWEYANTPHLDRLASEGLRFERALSSTPVTLPSHASLLTGLDPYRHGVRDNGLFSAGEELQTLAELLQAAGHRTAAFVSAQVLSRQYGLAQGFDRYDDDLGLSGSKLRVERKADETIDRVLAWLDDGGDDDEPWFAWVHLYDPHVPYQPPPAHRRRSFYDPSSWYDGEVAFADEQIGRLLDALESRGLAEDTLVIVTSDHGESLMEHGEATHGMLIYDATMHVPLLVRMPRSSAARTIGGQVALVDLFPTILDVLDIDVPDGLDGRSLIGVLAGSDDSVVHDAYLETLLPHFTLGWSPLAALSTGEYKYVAAPRPELYAWRSDPDEADDLVATRPEIAGDLAARLERLRGGPPDLDALVGGDLDDEERERLAALGYLSGAGDDALRGADPKDGIARLSRLRDTAASAMSQGRTAEAVSAFEELLDVFPGDAPAMALLGEARLESGDIDGAEEVLVVALSRRPDLVDAAIHLAHVYRLQGRPDDALEAYDTALAAAPHHTGALLEAAQLAFESGRLELALEYGERALATGHVPTQELERVQATTRHLREQLGRPADG